MNIETNTHFTEQPNESSDENEINFVDTNHTATTTESTTETTASETSETIKTFESNLESSFIILPPSSTISLVSDPSPSSVLPILPPSSVILFASAESAQLLQNTPNTVSNKVWTVENLLGRQQEIKTLTSLLGQVYICISTFLCILWINSLISLICGLIYVFYFLHFYLFIFI